jgi:general secretion pathway protein D
MKRTFQGVVLVLVLVTLVGCAAQKAYRAAEREMRRENWDKAVLGYSKALALKPGDSRYAVSLQRAKLKASADHFQKGQRYASSEQLDLAIAEFQQALLLNPGNQHANNELQRAVREKRRREAEPSTLERLKELARRKDMGPPKLDPRSNIPILLKFKETDIGKIFEAISKASGINFIFDDKVDLDKPMTIDIGNVSLEKALDVLMLQTKNFYKVIDEFTLLIAPDTRQKRQEYEDQVIRTFYLSNADTKQVVTLVRSLLQSRQISENADLNSVTIKDTPAKAAIAERIIASNDKSKGEVLVDVELMEINRNTASTLGLDLSSKTLTLQFKSGDERLPLNNLEPLRNTGNWTIGVIPTVTLDFLKTDSDTKLLAKPQVRVTEGERAEILIGDRIPIPTTSFNTSQTVGGNIVPITSFTYQNVGITVQIEPRVHHNKEVTLKLQVEMSQVTGSVPTGTGGQEQPIIGTRQIQSVIRLRDNETNILAGLITRQTTDSLSGIAGLMDIPGVRRVTGKTSRERRETDIIMTLTPRIIRIPDITEEDLATLWVGTEDNMQLRGTARQEMNQGPFAGGPTDAETVFGGGAGAAGGSAGGGSLSRVSPSSEVESDRARREAEDAQRQAAGETGAAGADETPPAGAPPPGGGTGPDDRSAPEEPEGEDEQEPPSGPAIVQLIPSSNNFQVGAVVVAQVTIDNAQNVGSVPFHLRYNKEVLQFMPPATQGPFMTQGGAEPVFLASDTGGGGEIVIGLSRMGPGAGASGSGVLAIFQFQAISPGNCGFAFTGASVKDPQARDLPAAFNVVPAQVQ